MIISLIGMSGVGKTFWSKKLEKKGFKRFGCDDIIEEKLGKELKRLGYSGINDVAKWLGQPYDTQYETTSKKYLELENNAMSEIFLRVPTEKGDAVIDTTGSVIYTNKPILKQLKKLTKVIYLVTPLELQKKMYILYLKDPKPVIWGNSFFKQTNESNLDALVRCYPRLLTFRAKEYEKLADVKIFLSHRVIPNNLIYDSIYQYKGE